MMLCFRRAAALVLALGLTTLAAGAQPLSFGQLDGPGVVILNQERVFAESLFGQRVQQELEAASAELAAENREIETALLEEERQLTDMRATMSAEEFRPLADEFDQRVEEIRAAQTARLRTLTALADRARQAFIELTTPILRELLQDRGASAVIDSRVVLYAAEGADITEAALERIDALLGDGGDRPILEQLGQSAP
jgi:Skp family chaperone for outer membrane proteins